MCKIVCMLIICVCYEFMHDYIYILIHVCKDFYEEKFLQRVFEKLWLMVKIRFLS